MATLGSPDRTINTIVLMPIRMQNDCRFDHIAIELMFASRIDTRLLLRKKSGPASASVEVLHSTSMQIGALVPSSSRGAPECAAAPHGAAGGAVGGGSGMVPLRKRMPTMNTSKAKSPASTKQTAKQAQDTAPPTSISSKPASKQQQLATLLVRDEGATLDQMIEATGWLPHTTRAALTGLKRKGYAISSDKLDGVRTYRAILPE